MAYIPDDLFEELHKDLNVLMSVPKRDDFGRWVYECSFCCLELPREIVEHRATCLGMRLMRAMDDEKRSQLGSG